MWCSSRTTRPRGPLRDVARAARKLTEHDLAAWATYARHVAPLPGHTAPALPELSLGNTVPRVAASRAAVGVGPAAGLVVGDAPPGVDKATWQRFRSGRIRATRTLDLHGRTAQRAFHALQTFLVAAHADRVRCVEIITGRGAPDGSTGVIRRELPLWLNLPPLRPLVLGAAHPHPANPGAVRLLLRRPR